MYRFLLSARWLGFAVFVIALAGVSIQLGFWQFGKMDDREARTAAIQEYFAADPVPLDQVAPAGTGVSRADEWRRVTVEGTYDPIHEITVKFVSRDGRPGVDVVTPLLLDDGTAVLVNRGFMVTQRTNTRPDDVPPAVSGTVRATGWLRVDNGAGPSATSVDDGQVRAISSTGLADHVPYELRSGYLNLQEQSPEQVGLEAEPQPDLGSGPHFFYGLQWWFFALLALVGYFWFARIEKRDGRPDLEQVEAERDQASATRSA
ncbi:SURF1 family protein [Aeromicrobium marinum]|uniref:SURF1 family cytochrome oxidase biogenesis protein n=1 Tax=Aeromicrobium marinum TaxID=219314 RepID=UPI0001BCCED6|nr:SURF1 family protein [Aeromicrobium marinum]